ncbi:hypothetical protein DRH14_03255, partial [Candidatus Shapirobacteria bacterium]
MNYKQKLSLIHKLIIFYFLLVLARLFYWQILKKDYFKEQALKQSYRLQEIPAQRGQIYSSDNYPLVQNQKIYFLSIYKPNLKKDLSKVIENIKQGNPQLSQPDLDKMTKFQNNPNQKWISLHTPFEPSAYQQLKDKDGLSFKTSFRRFYPEKKLASTVLGKVIKDVNGLDKAHGGLEAYYNRHLNGRNGYMWQNKDAKGNPNLSAKSWHIPVKHGQNLLTSINRAVQLVIEKQLATALNKYQADIALAIVLQPQTGAVIASSATYSAQLATDSASPLNPVISNLFEPGSIFKPLVVAIGLDSHQIQNDFICQHCNQAKIVDEYSIN